MRALRWTRKLSARNGAVASTAADQDERADPGDLSMR